MHGDHSRKNYAKTLLPIFNKYLLKAKFEYFITDNVFSNDTYITEIINLIRPDLYTKKRRLQYIGHIINLIDKDFIFGNQSQFFKADVAIAESTNDLEIAIKL